MPQGGAGDLPRGLLVTARHREDHVGAPPHRPGERVVGRGVAGVERHDEVDGAARVVVGDVAALETQALRVGPLRETGARRHDVLLEIEAHDLDGAAVHPRQEVVERERQVGLAAAEVDHPQRTIAAERRNDVVDQLDEAVDLLELRVARLPHAAVRRHHAELDEERHGRALRQQAAFVPVVRAARDRARRPAPQDRVAEYLPVGVGRLEETLPVVAEQLEQARTRGVRRHVVAPSPVGQVVREAVGTAVAQVERLDDHARRQGVAAAWSRQHRTVQRVAADQVAEQRGELAHASMIAERAVR
jgi:hypothetical protein